MKSRDESANLDFLRTVAVLFVVARHVMAALQYQGNRFFKPQLLGILGVLLFFVHTSLVLMFSLERQKQKHGTRRLYPTFLIRRCFRIYPLSIVVVALVFCLSVAWRDNPVSPVLPWRDLLSNLLLVQNLTASPNIISPLWSLPIEVQMYFFLPLLFLAVPRIGRRGLVFVVWPASVLIGLAQYRFPSPVSDVLKLAPCFLSGVICYTLSGARRVVSFWLLPLLLAACMLLYMMLGAYSQNAGGYPVCLMLGLSLPFIREMNGAAAGVFCHAVAKYSYSIYLLHAVCLAVVFALLPSVPVPGKLALFVLLTSILSFLCYHLIESPMIAVGNRIAARQHPGPATPTERELAAEEPSPVP